MMKSESALLAHHPDFGSVYRCSHGCYHVQVGAATIAMSDEQFQRFVAMLNDSAATYESLRYHPAGPGEADSCQAGG